MKEIISKKKKKVVVVVTYQRHQLQKSNVSLIYDIMHTVVKVS